MFYRWIKIGKSKELKKLDIATEEAPPGKLFINVLKSISLPAFIIFCCKLIFC